MILHKADMSLFQFPC